MQHAKEKDGGDGIKRPLDALLRVESHRLDAWRFQSLRKGLTQRGRSSSMTHFLEADIVTLALAYNAARHHYQPRDPHPSAC